MIIQANEYITDNFKFEELTCPCCDRIKIMPGLYHHMEKLEILRVKLGIPIIVSSGYRCDRHNEEVGGRPRSWHKLFATDIYPNIRQRMIVSHIEKEGLPINPDFVLQDMFKLAKEIGFGVIIYYTDRHFIHLDMRKIRLRMRV